MHLCRACGKRSEDRSSNCINCAVGGFTERLVRVAKLGREAARSPEARAKRLASHQRHVEARSAWDSSMQPAWLTSEVFSQQIQLLIADISTGVIRSRIRVSRWYAGKIRQGYVPHRRHWRALARLAGVSVDEFATQRPSALSLSGEAEKVRTVSFDSYRPN